MANSIIGAALSGHPNWAAPRPVTRPPAPPHPPGIASAGAAIQPSPPPPHGVGSAGSAILGTPPPPTAPLTGSGGSGTPWNGGGLVRTPGHAETTTVTPPPPDLSGSKWLAYLTPDQLNSLNQAGYQFTQQGSNWQAQINNANTDYNTTLANAQYSHDVSQAQAVEEMAARGLSVSGIRDTDLTDINRSLAERQALASQTLNTLVGEATRAITGLNNSWTSTQTAYQGDAAINAAASPEAQPYQQTTWVPNAPIQANTANNGSVNNAAINAGRGVADAGRALSGGLVDNLLGGAAALGGGAGSAVQRGARGLSRPRRH